MINAFIELLNQYEKVTVLTHKNPDADTIGTALGIYSILKTIKKHVEVVNIGKDYPKHLDFLPHFAKIKNRINFDNSLIISCDTGSIDILGFDLSQRTIVNIDHHQSNTHYGQLNIVEKEAGSASQVAYNLLKQAYKIDRNSATCFYVALVSDTQNFTTSNVTKNMFDMASELLTFGVDIEQVNRNLKQRKSLSSLRLLSSTLDTLVLSEQGEIADLFVSHKSQVEAGSSSTDDWVGLIDYALNLVTVRIAILLIEQSGSIKVSLRSKGIDIAQIATDFGGGGHKVVAGFEIEHITKKELFIKIKTEIKKRGLLNET